MWPPCLQPAACAYQPSHQPPAAAPEGPPTNTSGYNGIATQRVGCRPFFGSQTFTKCSWSCKAGGFHVCLYIFTNARSVQESRGPGPRLVARGRVVLTFCCTQEGTGSSPADGIFVCVFLAVEERAATHPAVWRCHCSHWCSWAGLPAQLPVAGGWVGRHMRQAAGMAATCPHATPTCPRGGLCWGTQWRTQESRHWAQFGLNAAKKRAYWKWRTNSKRSS